MKASYLSSINKLLFVDTETTGIPVDPTASYKNIDNWPTIIQIAWIIYNKKGKIFSSSNYAIENNGSVISSSGYVPKIVLPIHQILDRFLQDLSRCSVIIGHNIEYDVNVILCELYRYGKETTRLEKMQQFCTMKNSVEICGFDTSQGNRFPKLQELYSKLFHQPFENAHDAYCDIKATADCYWKIVNDGLLNIESFPFLMDSSVKAEKAKEYVDKAEELIANINKAPISLPSEEDYLFYWLQSQKSFYYIPRIGFDERSYYKLVKEHFNLHNYRIKEVKNWFENEIKRRDEQIKKQKEVKIRSYDEPISFLKKAADLGDSKSLYRIGQIYRYELHDNNTAYEWYRRAVEECYDLDCYFDFADLSTRIYGSKSVNGPVFFEKWANMCESGFNNIPRRHLELYIEACEKGRYGQTQDIQKAIDIYRRAIALNRSEFGRIIKPATVPQGIRFHGIRYKLASLLEEKGDKTGAKEQYLVYLEEIKAADKDAYQSSDIHEIEKKISELK